jgi:uncharacterized membrane protein
MPVRRRPEEGDPVLGVFDLYTVFKFVHVFAAIIWVGGAVTTNIQGTRIRQSGDSARLSAFGFDAEWIGTHVYLPASLTVLVFGLSAAIKAGYSFSSTWLIIGIVGIVITALTGSLFLGPETKRISALTAEKGAADPEVQAHVGRLIAISRIDLVVLMIVIIAMVFKPGAR